jgi:superfamily II DNA helicase RecQ
MKQDGPFEALLQKQAFTDRIICTIFDEAHCISTWGDFRPGYKEIGRLRHVLPKTIPIMVTSATLPPRVLNDVKDTLHLRSNHTDIFRCSIDRPNIHLVVRPIRSPLQSFEDLKFVLANWKPGDPPPPKFLVFFDNINEAITACQTLTSLLPPEYKDKLRWFNSDMSSSYKDDETERLLLGDAWGLFTTDSFGMVRGNMFESRKKNLQSFRGYGLTRHKACCPVACVVYHEYTVAAVWTCSAGS